MSNRVLCLRPEADFTRVDAAAPAASRSPITRRTTRRSQRLMKASDALVIPAVGPKLAPELFEGAALKLVQVTGAGVDRLDQAALTRLGIPVANVAGRQQQRGGRICRHRGVDAAAALRLGGRRDQGRQLREIPRPHGGRQSRRHRGSAGRPRRLRHHRPRGGAGVRPHGREGLLLRSGDRATPTRRSTRAPMSLDELLATSDVVSLHVPLLPATQNLIGAARAGAHEARRGADPGLARRHRRRGGAGGEPGRRPSRRRRGRRLFDRAAGGRQSAAEARRRGRVAAAADAAHRRRHAPSLDDAVPLGLAERRAGADANISRRSTGCIELLLLRARGFRHRRPSARRPPAIVWRTPAACWQ